MSSGYWAPPNDEICTVVANRGLEAATVQISRGGRRR